MSAKRGLRIRGLRQRWLVNAVLPIVLVVIAIVTVYTLGVRRTYYSAMRSGLETRARVAADNFSSYGLRATASISATPPSRRRPLRKRTGLSFSSSTSTAACRCRATA